MAYTIEKTNNTILTVIEDGTIDNTTDLKLVGKNYSGYGEIQNENFVSLLENFASNNQPPRPLAGQLWFDTSTNKLKVYDGNEEAFFNPIANLRIGTLPTGADIATSNVSEGDFWWDDTSQQIYVYNGNQFILIGPKQSTSRQTEVVEQLVYDNLLAESDTTPELKEPHEHLILKCIVDNKVIAVISKDTFTLDNSNTISGFNMIKAGITLVDVDPATGLQAGLERFHGTAVNTERLGTVLAQEFVQRTGAIFTDLVKIDVDEGLRIGENEDFVLNVSDDNALLTLNPNAKDIKFVVHNQVAGEETPVIINHEGVFPGLDSEYNLGSSIKRWNTIYANNIDATINRADTLLVDTNYRSATTLANANSVAARDASGDIYANYFRGIAVQADNSAQADTLKTDGNVWRPGSTTAQANTVAVRNASGAIVAEEFTGLATRAATLQVGTAFRSAAEQSLPYTIPVRNSNGTIYGNFEGTLVGNSSTTTRFQTPVLINFTGDASGSVSISGTEGSVDVPINVGTNSVTLGTDTTGNYVQSLATDTGENYLKVKINGVIGAGARESAIALISLEANSINDPDALVARDGAGNFAAGRITAENKFVGHINEEGTQKNGYFNNLYVDNLALVSPLPIIQGGTGATTAPAARTNLDIYSKAEVVALVSGEVAGIDTSVDRIRNTDSTSSAIVTTNIDFTVNGEAICGVTSNGIAMQGSNKFIGDLQGNAATANYADLAEKYTTDDDHSEGTVMMIGVTEESEAQPATKDSIPVGVVSLKPAFLMNAEAEGQALALKGRVPVRVMGSVSKGDAVYVYENGTASTEYTEQHLVGVALESSTIVEEKLIECILKL